VDESNNNDKDEGTVGATEDGGDDEEEEEHIIYKKTNPEHWTCIKPGGRAQGRDAEPIPFSGDTEEFDVNITDEELEKLKDESGDIRFYKVMEWLLPDFDGESFWEWLAARMRNYMLYLMDEKEWKPRYYDPSVDNVILADHVTRFFGSQSSRMLRGFPSINKTWSTRESLDAIGVVKESMPKDAFRDLYRCLHFTDDWEGEEGINWEDKYLDAKYESCPDSAKHRKKFGAVEDAFNARWKECVTFGKWLTFDESRVADWYHSPIILLVRSQSQFERVRHFILSASRKVPLNVKTSRSCLRRKV